MKTIVAALFAATLFSALNLTVAEPLADKRTLFTCPKYCSFPRHSTPSCNFITPCGFTCTDGYFPDPIWKPTACKCPFPLTECNGECGYHKACPSKGHSRRDITEQNVNCPTGQSACGVLGRPGAWECLDTSRDLESCGGCVVSLTSYGKNGGGRDCTAINGVSDVACVQSQCQVKKCSEGYEVSELGDSCIVVEKKKSVLSLAEEVLIAQFRG